MHCSSTLRCCLAMFSSASMYLGGSGALYHGSSLMPSMVMRSFSFDFEDLVQQQLHLIRQLHRPAAQSCSGELSQGRASLGHACAAAAGQDMVTEGMMTLKRTATQAADAPWRGWA